MSSWIEVVHYCTAYVCAAVTFCVFIFYVSGCAIEEIKQNAAVRKAYYEAGGMVLPRQGL